MSRLEQANLPRRLWKHTFAIAASVLLAGTCVGVSGYPQQVGRSTTQQFDGTWKAVDDGKVFIVLKLGAENGHPSGTIQVAGFELDLQGTGGLLSVTDEELDKPIKLQHIRFNDKILSFDFVDNDGDDDKWTMELTAANQADFLWVGLPKGLKAKPIVLTKETSTKPKAN